MGGITSSVNNVKKRHILAILSTAALEKIKDIISKA